MPKAVDHPVFALDPLAIVEGSTRHREMEELLPAARNINCHRLTLLPRSLHQRQTHFQRRIIAKTRELDIFLLLPQLLEQFVILAHMCVPPFLTRNFWTFGDNTFAQIVTPLDCHSERSEASHSLPEMLRCAQNDNQGE